MPRLCRPVKGTERMEMVRLERAGYRPSEIAAALNRPMSTVYRYIEKRPKQQPTPEEYAEVIEAYEKANVFGKRAIARKRNLTFASLRVFVCRGRKVVARAAEQMQAAE